MAGHLAVLCGQILVVGLSGTELAPDERRLLESGARGGVVFFRRNVSAAANVEALRVLSKSVLTAGLTGFAEAPPLVAIDQEGGRVVRIGAPALALPPMRKIGDINDVDFTERLAEAQARELFALGITMSFAPVADIHTRPENPIIGDRAFASTAEGVAKHARAWARGLARGNVLSCAKHFPGHGDTTSDSHLELPRVERPRAELEAIEIASFREMAKEPAIASMMTAHVVYPALDPTQPATLSHAICTDLLRGELRFEGVLFSDDLEMKAIAIPAAEAAVRAINAGCDSLLVCSRADMAAEAHEALIHEVEKSPAFRSRMDQAHHRVVTMRKKLPSPLQALTPLTDLKSVFDASAKLAAELATRLSS